jgi:hypothetical protein
MNQVKDVKPLLFLCKISQRLIHTHRRLLLLNGLEMVDIDLAAVNVSTVVKKVTHIDK